MGKAGSNQVHSGESKSPRKYGRRYPWEKWIKVGQTVTLEKGKDFNGRIDTFAQQIRNRASLVGVRVSVKLSDDGDTVTVTTMEIV